MEDDLDIMERMDEFYDELNFDVPDVDIEYEEQTDEGCEGGACKI
jgi:hypothetical protein